MGIINALLVETLSMVPVLSATAIGITKIAPYFMNPIERNPIMSDRQARKKRRKLSQIYPATLTRLPREEWPQGAEYTTPKRIDAWISRQFLVQIFQEELDILRLSVLRTTHTNGEWGDGITWDELQQIKNDVGFADYDAVELFPAKKDVVNIANIRHLWIMPTPVPFAWRRNVQT